MELRHKFFVLTFSFSLFAKTNCSPFSFDGFGKLANNVLNSATQDIPKTGFMGNMSPTDMMEKVFKNYNVPSNMFSNIYSESSTPISKNQNQGTLGIPQSGFMGNMSPNDMLGKMFQKYNPSSNFSPNDMLGKVFQNYNIPSYIFNQNQNQNQQSAQSVQEVSTSGPFSNLPKYNWSNIFKNYNSGTLWNKKVGEITTSPNYQDQGRINTEQGSSNGDLNCMNNWDFIIAARENAVNKALENLPMEQTHNYEKLYEFDMMDMKTNFILREIQIESMKLNTIEDEEQVVGLSVIFAGGEVELNLNSTYFQRNIVLPMADEEIQLKLNVSALTVEIENDGVSNLQSLVLRINQDNAIEYLNSSVHEMRLSKLWIQKALQSAIGNGTKLDIGSYDLQIGTTLKDIFPTAVRFSASYAPNNMSVIAAFATANEKHGSQIILNCNTKELIPAPNEAMIMISGSKFKEINKTVIADSFSTSSLEMITGNTIGHNEIGTPYWTSNNFILPITSITHQDVLVKET